MARLDRFRMSAIRSLLGANRTSRQSHGANDPGCVKTKKIVEGRERFFQDRVKSDSLANFCAPKREFAKCPCYRIRPFKRFYTPRPLPHITAQCANKESLGIIATHRVDRRAIPSRNADRNPSYRGNTVSLTASGARSGWPASNGGAGLYSRLSWIA